MIAEEDLAQEIFTLLYRLVGNLRQYFDQTAADFGLPSTQAKALLRLAEPAPMSTLAAALQCDPSNVTGIVDGLESRGLVERRVAERDRRVKHLAVTVKGVRLRSRLRKRLFENMPAVSGLAHSERLLLRDLLHKGLADDLPSVS